MISSKTKPSGLIFPLCYLAYSVIYIARLNFSVISEELNKSGALSMLQIGSIGSVFFFVYAFSKLFSSRFGDRISPRKMIITGLALTGLSNIFISVSPVFMMMAVMWGINALGQSLIWGPMLSYLSLFYSGEKLKSRNTMLVSSVSAGSILGLGAGTWSAAAGNIPMAFLIPGLIVLAMAAVSLLLPASVPAQKPPALSFRQIVEVLRQKRFGFIVVPTVAHGLIKDNINIWMVLFVANKYGVDLVSISGYIFFIPIMGLAGRLLYPLLYRLAGRSDSRVSVFSFTVSILALLPLIFGKASFFVAICVLGIVSAMISAVNSHLLSNYPVKFKENGSISYIAGLMDFLSYAGAGVGSVVFGLLVQSCGYESMFLVWALVSAVSAVLLAVQKRTRKDIIKID